MYRVLSSLLLITSLNAQDLKTTVEEVLSTNPIVQERLKNYNAIKEDITSAESGYYPKLDLNLGVGHERTNKTDADGNNIPLNDYGHYNVYQNSLKYTHNLFNGFSTTYQIQEQEHRTLSSAYSYIEKANDTSFNMVNQYLQVMKNQELLLTAKENVTINEEILNKVEKLYEAGLTTLSEVNKIKSSLSLARSNLVVQENSILDVSYNFQRVLGRYMDPTSMSKPDVEITLPSSQEEATQFAMKNNPSLLVSEYNIRLAQATNQEKLSPFYPKIDIEVSGSMNKNLSGVEGEDDRFRAMAYLTYNIFNGFSDTAAIQKSTSQIHQEVESKNDLRRQVIEGINLAWAANTKLQEQLVYLENYKKYSLKTLTLYSKEYDLGRRSLLDLLSAQNDFIGAKAQIISTKYSMLFAKYRILDAMGTLIQTVIGDAEPIHSNVGLVSQVPKNSDELPISFDKDRDLIVDEMDICNNSLETQMKNIYGCKLVDSSIAQMHRHGGFLFDGEEIQEESSKKLQSLLVKLKSEGVQNTSFTLLANAKTQELSKKRATVVTNILLNAGVSQENISIISNADQAPISTDETLNERVDIIVTKTKEN
ncbi:MAG: TolC family outer membrane protein [Campylobacterota bacterium]|nr:TolC family outer membrane protein [Campylobacterota bacterium]